MRSSHSLGDSMRFMASTMTAWWPTRGSFCRPRSAQHLGLCEFVGARLDLVMPRVGRTRGTTS